MLNSSYLGSYNNASSYPERLTGGIVTSTESFIELNSLQPTDTRNVFSFCNKTIVIINIMPAHPPTQSWLRILRFRFPICLSSADHIHLV